MGRLRAWARRFSGLVASDRRERELADEIASHLAIHTDENIRRGMAPDAARRDALLKLGSVDSLKEQYRDQRGVPLLEHALQDFRYGLRSLARNPGLSVVTVITLAAGIAGPTTMFSMIRAWILEPLP